MRHSPSVRAALTVVCCALLLLCHVAVPVRAVAGDERYSLGTVQEEASLQVEAGGQTGTTIGLYNIDGTVPVRARLTVLDLPDGWMAALVPACEDPDKTVPAGGHDALELLVEPMQVFSERPVCEAPCAKAYWLPGRGYVCAAAVELRLAAPRQSIDGPLLLRVLVTGLWEDFPGAMPQERELVYDVTVAEARAPQALWQPFTAVLILVGVVALMLVRRIARSPRL